MKSTSIFLSGYMLTFKAHPAHPEKVQLLLTDGVDLLSESWVDKSKLLQVIDPVIVTEV